MKATSSRFKAIVASVSTVVLSVFVVVPAFAVETTTGENRDTSATVCSRITTFAKTGKENLSEKRSTLQTDFSKRLSGIATKQTDVDKKVSEARLAAKTKFEEKIAKLEAKEDLTDVQKAAIETYKTEVQAAEVTRAAAIDDARAAYRTGLASLVTTNQQTLSSAVTTYQTAVSTALATATANCTEANATATLATLKASLKSAREVLNAKRTPDTNKAAIKQLATTRDAAIKAANEAFKTKVTALTVTLKAALQVTDTPATDTTNQ